MLFFFGHQWKYIAVWSFESVGSYCSLRPWRLLPPSELDAFGCDASVGSGAGRALSGWRASHTAISPFPRCAHA